MSPNDQNHREHSLLIIFLPFSQSSLLLRSSILVPNALALQLPGARIPADRGGASQQLSVVLVAPLMLPFAVVDVGAVRGDADAPAARVAALAAFHLGAVLLVGRSDVFAFPAAAGSDWPWVGGERPFIECQHLVIGREIGNGEKGIDADIYIYMYVCEKKNNLLDLEERSSILAESVPTAVPRLHLVFNNSQVLGRDHGGGGQDGGEEIGEVDHLG